MNNTKQRGFTLLAYFIWGTALLAALYGLFQWLDNNWITDAGIAKGRAEIQPKLDECINYRDKLIEKLNIQNTAVENLKKDADKRARDAAAALAKARTDGKAKEAEISRLSAFKANPQVASSCAKGVEAVRSLLN